MARLLQMNRKDTPDLTPKVTVKPTLKVFSRLKVLTFWLKINLTRSL